MVHRMQFYIDGNWVDPVTPKTIDVINPANEEAFARDLAGLQGRCRQGRRRRPARVRDLLAHDARGARRAAREDRRGLQGPHQGNRRGVSDEMGAPLSLAEAAQAATGLGHLHDHAQDSEGLRVRGDRCGTAMVVREPVGVVGMITPWNWPINQIACKVAPALAAGCTMVLKPSEVAPMDADLSPKSCTKRACRRACSTSSTATARRSAKRCRASGHRHDVVHRLDPRRHRGRQGAAPTVKRVAQELGGKSPNIVLDDADLTRRSRAA